MPDFISETLHLNTKFVKIIADFVSETPDFYVLYIFIYLLPSFIAYSQKKYNLRSIFIYNVIFGFTGISWFVILIWAIVEAENKLVKPNIPIAELCPYCKELIRPSSTICCHCHQPLEPAKPQNDSKPSVSK